MIGGVTTSSPDWLERVITDQDRSATLALLDRIAEPDLGADQRAEIVRALTVLADPRSLTALIAAGEDPALPGMARRAALNVLSWSGLGPEGPALRRWWATGDPELQAYVLIEAERSDPLHAAAVRGLEFGFEEPGWQDCKIAALTHPAPDVREAAADVLEWDEPVRAEAALQRAAQDPDPSVASGAIRTLSYYESKATFRLLSELADGQDASRSDAARESADEIRGDFLSSLLRAQGQQAARLRQWMAPVWDLLAFTSEELQPESGPVTSSWTPRSQTPPPAARLLATCADPDGPWSGRLEGLRRYDWPLVPESDRALLAASLCAHPDPAVRAAICRALADWEDTDRLLAIAHDDPISWVRKSAIYELHSVPASREVSEFTWDLVATGQLAAVAGREALRTYAAHAPGAESTGRLLELALGDLRENVRDQAVLLLGKPHLGSLLPLLDDPPLMTWGVHCALLDLCAAAGRSSPARPLDQVDDRRDG